MKSIPLMAAMLCVAATGFAQTRYITFVKKDGHVTTNRDSAVLIRTIVSPAAGSKLYAFTETRPNGQLVRDGYTMRGNEILLNGELHEYYPSGQMSRDMIYDTQPQKETLYYPNGKVYMVKEHVVHTPDPAKPHDFMVEIRIVSSNDSTGKTLITNGTGYFTTYHIKPVPANLFDQVYAAPGTMDEYLNVEGNLKDNKRVGKWNGRSEDGMLTYTDEYDDDGKFVSGVSVWNGGKPQKYKQEFQVAEFKGGINMFYQFLANNIRYPSADRTMNIQGKVFATFVVEKDGSLSNIKILRGISEATSAETLRVLQLSSPWKPSVVRGVPVRTQYTVPVSFTLSSK